MGDCSCLIWFVVNSLPPAYKYVCTVARFIFISVIKCIVFYLAFEREPLERVLHTSWLLCSPPYDIGCRNRNISLIYCIPLRYDQSLRIPGISRYDSTCAAVTVKVLITSKEIPLCIFDVSKEHPSNSYFPLLNNVPGELPPLLPRRKALFVGIPQVI